MKAIQCKQYGPPSVLELVDIPQPTVSKGDVLVKVHYTAVTAADYRIRGAKFPKGFGLLARLGLGITKPRSSVLGSTFAGIVEQVGDEVTEFAVGDRVAGMTGIKMGTYAEYIAMPAKKGICKVADSIQLQDVAAVLFGGSTAKHFVQDKLDIKVGDTVLVNGASGSVGSAAVSIAKHLGAKVTGVCSSKNSEVVKQLGADAVIDYKTTSIEEFGKYDYVLDCVGNITKADYNSVLNATGTMVLVVADMSQMMHGILPKSISKHTIITSTATETKQDVQQVVALLRQGVIQPTIDKEYSLEDIVAAHTYADTGRKVGNIIIIAHISRKLDE